MGGVFIHHNLKGGVPYLLPAICLLYTSGTGTREGEDTDNAKYYAEQAEAIVGGDFATKTEAQQYASTAKEEAIQTSAADATTKANAAETAAKEASRPVTWTPTAAEVGAVPTSRTVNGKALSADITLTAADVGADPAGSAAAVQTNVNSQIGDIGTLLDNINGEVV